MRPFDLKPSFSFQDRKVCIEDGVFYIPEHFHDPSFAFPGWNHEIVFPKSQPICIEFCSGNGDWIAKRARDFPHLNWVAVEMQFSRVQKIWSKKKNHALSNLFIVCGEGYCASNRYFPQESVEQIYVNFPDPWPKRRHAKHRIVRAPFVEEVHRLLKKDGTLMLVTDDENYSNEMIGVLLNQKGFASFFDPPYFVEDFPEYGSSYFESIWKKQGKTIRYHLFKKV